MLNHLAEEVRDTSIRATIACLLAINGGNYWAIMAGTGNNPDTVRAIFYDEKSGRANWFEYIDNILGRKRFGFGTQPLLFNSDPWAPFEIEKKHFETADGDNFVGCVSLVHFHPAMADRHWLEFFQALNRKVKVFIWEKPGDTL